MNKSIGLLLLLAVLAFACEKKRTYFKAPISDLGHIDLVLDSVAFYSVLKDSFLTREFAFMSQDTVTYGGKPSYDIYLAGQENFLHISLAKGYWQNKTGSGVLVFQTQKPDMKDSLLIAWKQYYTDSLSDHVFKGDNFDLGEVMAYYPAGQRSDARPIFFSNLTSYSQQSYRNWGISDSSIFNGVSMREFMNWHPTIPEKLFNKITRLTLRVTDTEFKDLESALKTVGYTQSGDRFIHQTNPEVSFEIDQKGNFPKYKLVEIEMARPAPDRKFAIGDMYDVDIHGTKMILTAVDKSMIEQRTENNE